MTDTFVPEQNVNLWIIYKHNNIYMRYVHSNGSTLEGVLAVKRLSRGVGSFRPTPANITTYIAFLNSSGTELTVEPYESNYRIIYPETIMTDSFWVELKPITAEIETEVTDIEDHLIQLSELATTAGDSTIEGYVVSMNAILSDMKTHLGI